MTKQEFIIQYVLQHKEMPFPLLIEEMEENKCFDTPEVAKDKAIGEEGEIIKYNPDNKEYTNLKVGTKVMFTNPCRPLSCPVVFPRGYVAIVYSMCNNRGSIRILTTCITDGKKTSNRIYMIHGVECVISNLAITQDEPSHIEDTLTKGNEYTTRDGKKGYSSIHNYKVII